MAASAEFALPASPIRLAACARAATTATGQLAAKAAAEAIITTVARTRILVFEVGELCII